MHSLDQLKSQVLATTGTEERVEVNQRHLIDKILARYSAEFTVYRELLQNANDAGAESVEIHFSGIEKGSMWGFTKDKYSILTVKNDGREFGTEDWSRLRKIAEGNPDEQKIGFFGLTISVTSGKDCMAFFWRGDQLLTKRAAVPEEQQSRWTSFFMKLREPGELPDLDSLAKFVSTSIAFTSTLSEVTVYFEKEKLFSVRKIPTPASNVDLSAIKSLRTTSDKKLLTISSVNTHQVQMTATFTKRDTPEVIFIRIATAMVDVNAPKQLSSEIERTTKKNPPKKTKIQMLYTGLQEYEASQHTNHSKGVFTGLFPFPEQGRIFIGFPTHQSTGISSHIAAHFIPTVERESIDFVEPSLSYWNKSLLQISGCLSRILYENEMREIQQIYSHLSGAVDDSEPLKYLERRAVHAMQSFEVAHTTPYKTVGQELSKAFFTATNMPPLIISTKGIFPANKVRLPNKEITFLSETPIVPEKVLENCKNFVKYLEEDHLLVKVGLLDVMQEVEKRRLPDNDLASLLKWWLLQKKDRRVTLDQQIKLFSKIRLGDQLHLSDMKYFLNSGVIAPNLPLPNSLIPYQITKSFSKKDLEELNKNWKELSVIDWMQYIVLKPEFTSNNEFANSILSALCKNWNTTHAETRKEVTNLVSKYKCIPTKHGMVLPSEAYLKKVNLFPDLPLVEVPKNINDGFLVALGVRDHVELQLVFNRLGNLGWDHYQMVRFLASQRNSITSEELTRLRATKFFPREERNEDTVTKSSVLFRAEDLYIPIGALRELRLPLMFWPRNKWVPNTDETKFLVECLGLNTFPQAKELMEICSSPDSDTRKLAINYFIQNYEEKYKDTYVPQKVTTPFLPCEGSETLLLPGECYSDPGAGMLGFEILRADLRPHADKFGVKQHPSSDSLINRLKFQIPNSENVAKQYFEYFATQQSSFSKFNWAVLLILKFIPVKDKSGAIILVTPKECYFRSRESIQYEAFFNYIDYGSIANKFLQSCGVREEPSQVDIARMVSQSPEEFLQLCGQLDKYLEVLRKLAVNLNTLKVDKALFSAMKKSPFLVAYKIKETENAASEKAKKTTSMIEELGNDMNTSAETSNQLCKLAIANEIDLIDDVVLQRTFKPLSAPVETVLEKFYEELGSEWISTKVRETHDIKGQPQETPFANNLEALIKERTPLIYFDFHQSNRQIKISEESLLKKLKVVEVSEICIKREYLSARAVNTQLTSAYIEHSGGGLKLYFTRNDFDFFDVARSLGQTIFNKFFVNDAFLLSALLSPTLESLRNKGFPVDRIKANATPINVQATAVKATQPSTSNLPYRDLEAKVRRLQEFYPDADEAFIRDELRKEKSNHLENVAERMSTGDYPKKKESKVQTLDEKKKDTIKQQPQDKTKWNQLSQFINKRNSDSSSRKPARPGKAPVTTTIDETTVERLHKSLESAINSCRPYDSKLLKNEPEVRVFAESQATRCEEVPGNKLADIGKFGGFSLYLDKDLDQSKYTSDESFISAANHFANIMDRLAQTFKLKKDTIHIFYSKSGSVIAFNRRGSLFMNLRYFIGLHMPKMHSTKEAFNAYVYWFLTFCHELAHNFLDIHNAQHENNTSQSWLPCWLE